VMPFVVMRGYQGDVECAFNLFDYIEGDATLIKVNGEWWKVTPGSGEPWFRVELESLDSGLQSGNTRDTLNVGV